jgi:hypothetical protein
MVASVNLMKGCSMVGIALVICCAFKREKKIGSELCCEPVPFSLGRHSRAVTGAFPSTWVINEWIKW